MKKLIILIIVIFFSCSRKESTWTKIIVKNSSTKVVTVWLTIGVPYSMYVNDVYLIFGIQQHGLVGTFELQPDENRSYTSLTGFSGNLSFNTPPQNCPDDRIKYPMGISFFEFCINNWMQPDGKNPQETVDISCVSGISCSLECTVGGMTWNASTLYPDIKFFANAPWGKNTGLPGVFPVGCDVCVKIVDPGRCSSNHVPYEKPNTYNICTVQRNAVQYGDKGTVFINYRGENFIQ